MNANIAPIRIDIPTDTDVTVDRYQLVNPEYPQSTALVFWSASMQDWDVRVGDEYLPKGAELAALVLASGAVLEFGPCSFERGGIDETILQIAALSARLATTEPLGDAGMALGKRIRELRQQRGGELLLEKLLADCPLYTQRVNEGDALATQQVVNTLRAASDGQLRGHAATLAPLVWALPTRMRIALLASGHRSRNVLVEIFQAGRPAV